MVTHRRKKVTPNRGHTTHGCGSKKKNRGAGNRGGRGNAGRGKKSDHRKHMFIVKGIFLGGRSGFKMHGVTKDVRFINIEDVQSRLESWLKEGKVEKKEGVYIIDGARIGFEKILGAGHVRAKLRVIAQCSQKAAEKIKKAGGEVVAPTE